MWAVSMQTSVTAVTAKIKAVVAVIKTTEEFTVKNLRIICNEVSTSQLPPSAACVEAGTCIITQVCFSCICFYSSEYMVNIFLPTLPQSTSSGCINLSGNSKSNSVATAHPKLLIHPSLFHFFTMVWYVQKIEYIIRNYTRWWLEQQDGKNVNIEQLCIEFSRDDALFSSMHAIFNHAVSHVTKSIEAYQD
jgi:hypothetical protein